MPFNIENLGEIGLGVLLTIYVFEKAFQYFRNNGNGRNDNGGANGKNTLLSRLRGETVEYKVDQLIKFTEYVVTHLEDHRDSAVQLTEYTKSMSQTLSRIETSTLEQNKQFQELWRELLRERKRGG